MAVPLSGGVDASYPCNIATSRDFFYKIPKDSHKWIAAVNEQGKGLLQCSTNRLFGRKLFAWGMAQGGRHWNEWLSERGSAYIEIQAGLARTQLEHIPMKGKESWEWVEAYTGICGNATDFHGDYKAAVVKDAGAGVAGVGAGVAVVALGPTAAMGIATTFGVASTGTAISTLSGAAATNAALAWLGGGALAAGGGGMAAGNAFLALAGPIGWAIAGVALVASGLMFWKSLSDKKHIEDIFTLISKRDVKSYELAIVELNERISRIINESELLNNAISKIESVGTDYHQMTEDQQYELGSYVNLMSASTRLLVNPILGLLPKYTNDDFEEYRKWDGRKIGDSVLADFKDLIISFANLLFKIDLSDKDKKMLYKTFRANKKMLKSLNMKKKEFVPEIIDAVEEALSYKGLH